MTLSLPSRGVLGGLSLLVVLSCDSRSSREGAPSRPRIAADKPPPPPSSAALPASKLDRAAAPPGDLGAKAKPRPPEPLPPTEKDDLPVENSRYVLDGLNDVGPAAPASAFAQGVVLISRDDELVISRRLQPPSKSKQPVAAPFQEITRAPGDFLPVARGPAVSNSHAYWITKGRVVRRALAGGELEVLANDARSGTRVAVAGPPDVVAYITEPVGKQDSLARLRLPDGRRLDLTPEGAAASSVSLARVGQDVIASYIDGRSGMTPVHARKLRMRDGTLEPDVVVWVSGATQGMTEISSVGTDAGSWLVMPVERDASHFGLATLAVDREPKMDPPLRWRTYENGLDRSPAAAATLCGAPVTIYVRPADSTPAAKQELMLSELTLDLTAGSEQLASARGFADVSLYPVPEGAVLAYVADRRTWARLIRCK